MFGLDRHPFHRAARASEREIEHRMLVSCAVSPSNYSSPAIFSSLPPRQEMDTLQLLHNPNNSLRFFLSLTRGHHHGWETKRFCHCDAHMKTTGTDGDMMPLATPRIYRRPGHELVPIHLLSSQGTPPGWISLHFFFSFMDRANDRCSRSGWTKI